ncbi:hypothetical protein KW787_00280 [Candidatus Pacearchaeota archaeon]|nr:hypothetical protein [Candidatus Pacearchaeota archaeon]
MAETIPDIGTLVNGSQLAAGFWQSIPSEAMNKLYSLFGVAKILLLIVAVYFIILIITKIMRLRDSRNLSLIEKNVEQINEKLSALDRKKKK